ncbi:pyridoxal phosphate-dependent transferase [Ephemerocybe angulata]|uniref:Pyridoxal phosphate-dependent transferase n=1 Tax=Ephemerocybe angulata TaxID=980116 RepID=A0A8H6IDQ4_9AGAR|nr:pyridoxal phosphate-dependent transferase [Tulosesus angulatus]
MASFDIAQTRSQFPSLKSGFIFGDNAGGSQIAQEVIDRLNDYLINTNAQLGADYSVSAESTRRVMKDAPTEAAKLFNARSPDEIVFAASSTLNLDNLARSLERKINDDAEIIVTGEHEANVGPWKKLANRIQIGIKYWRATPTKESNPYSVALKVEDVLPLITAQTRIVAFTACSNILGSIIPVKEYVKTIRARAAEVGASQLEISVDCVAYAPHRKIDVQDWDLDYAVLSYYKVIRATHLSDNSVSPLVHHFIKADDISYKLQPGGPGYETVYATTGVNQYLLSLTPANDLNASFAAIAAHEQTLLETDTVGLNRAPTISFVVVGEHAMQSKDVVKDFDAEGKAGIRWGHFYAYTLIDDLSPKLDVNDGVVRISLVHYNTVEDVQYITDMLQKVLQL